MFENSSTRYYQDNKERLQKELLEDVKVFLKKEKENSGSMVVIDTKRCARLLQFPLLMFA